MTADQMADKVLVLLLGAQRQAEMALLDQVALPTMTEAQKAAPRKTGRLKKSAYVAQGGKKIAVGTDAGLQMIGALKSSPVLKLELGFDAADPKGHVYAVTQHERTDLKHATGGAKFLENPVKAETGQVAPKLATAVRGALRK